MAKYNNDIRNNALNVAALSSETAQSEKIKKVDLKDISKDVKAESEADIKASRDAIVTASAYSIIENPLSAPVPIQAQIASISIGLAHPIMYKPAAVMHQMLMPGREVVASHEGIVGELQTAQIQAEKEGSHGLAAEFYNLLGKLGDATNHIFSMGEHANHPLVKKLKSLLHGNK